MSFYISNLKTDHFKNYASYDGWNHPTNENNFSFESPVTPYFIAMGQTLKVNFKQRLYQLVTSKNILHPQIQKFLILNNFLMSLPRK